MIDPGFSGLRAVCRHGQRPGRLHGALLWPLAAEIGPKLQTSPLRLGVRLEHPWELGGGGWGREQGVTSC